MTEEEIKSLLDAYKSTIEARNFHYDNFSKWMTYYYVAVAAIFIAFYSGKIDNEYKLGIIFLGFFISILWHLSCKGYYFWIKNWTHLINRFESTWVDNEKVYSVFSNHVKEKHNNFFNPLQSANISTSKTTLLLSFIISLFWCFLLLDLIVKYFCNFTACFCLVAIFSVLLTLMSIMFLGQFLKSDISHHKLLDV